jgi:hypothetical protein
MSLLSSVLNRLRFVGQADSNPLQVIEMREHSYNDRLVNLREDGLVVYSTPPTQQPVNNNSNNNSAGDPNNVTAAVATTTTMTTTNSLSPPCFFELTLHKPIHAKDGWKAYR